jgi:nucleotide-binding universal stress UspA family protein
MKANKARRSARGSFKRRKTLPRDSDAPLLDLKEILVPVDFSECSRAALRYALPLAQQFGATLTLLNVVDFYLAGELDARFDYARLRDDLQIRAGKRLVHLIQQDVGSNVLVDTLVREGRPWKEITDAARKRKADLIILGTHGYSGLKHTLLGSTAERVVRHAPCPVLVVREHERDFV